MPDTQSLHDIVDHVDQMVHDELSGTKRAFHLGRSRLYGVDANRTIEIIGEYEDPYDLLVLHNRPVNAVAAVLVVTGWAAPISEDGSLTCRPSQHSAKVRIRITVAVSDDGIASLMRRADAPNEVTYTDERGIGMLPDALECWWTLD